MKLPFLIICISTMAIACSPVKVLNTEQGDNIDFTKYKTYNFYRLKASGDTVSKLFEGRIDILKNAISNELNKRGYTLATSNPDMLVNIGVVVKDEVQTRQTDFRTDAPRYIGQRNYSWKSETIEVGRYREGTVTVHLVDAVQNKMIWKGTIEGVIPEKTTAIQKTAEEGIKKLFEKYPVVTR